MNPDRIDILEYVLRHPGCTVGEVARALDDGSRAACARARRRLRRLLVEGRVVPSPGVAYVQAFEGPR